LLERFSKEYNFAHETKGSSPTHNAKLIPLLMANACHILRNTEEYFSDNSALSISGKGWLIFKTT